MPDEEMTSLKLRIAGRVQGVGYRAFAAAAARELNIRGWVRNRADRSVEVVACGTTERVEAFVAACTRGPAGAQVKSVDLEPMEPPAQKGFHLRPTV